MSSGRRGAVARRQRAPAGPWCAPGPPAKGDEPVAEVARCALPESWALGRRSAPPARTGRPEEDAPAVSWGAPSAARRSRSS
eukprot:5963053-Alexandrium_andersonii.AAC.1